MKINNYQEKLLKLADSYDLSTFTLRAIGRLLDEKKPVNPQVVIYHLEKLNDKGLLFVDLKQKIIRKIKLDQSPNSQLVSLPILGQANCGPANIFAEEYVKDYLRVSPTILDVRVKTKIKKVYIIEASGDSMNQARVGEQELSIEDGDYVVVDESDRSPRDGDYVLSVIDGMANIKKFKLLLQYNQIALISESNKDYPPIIIGEEDSYSYMVNGVVLQVIKKPKD